jgi:integrase
MKAYPYSGAFASDIEAFIAFKASVGIYSDSRAWTLYDFDRWCVASGAAEFDRATVEGWVKQRKGKTSPDHLSWMSHVRELGRYLRVNGSSDAYVLSDEFKARMVRVTPYLLTQSEADGFFAAAAMFDNGTPWTWQATCFFGLMHACGLRTCEVRHLRVGDVDYESPSIDIMWSKGNRSRRLAITDEVADMLKACDALTAAEFGKDRSAFFVGAAGDPVTGERTGVMFRRIWQMAGLPDSKDGKRPRPYCFRHRFAYANLERWRKEGIDTAAMLPYLARYMGHATFDSTYYYIHTSPDFMDAYADVVADSDDAVLPEVGFDA